MSVFNLRPKRSIEGRVDESEGQGEDDPPQIKQRKPSVSLGDQDTHPIQTKAICSGCIDP